MTTRVQKMTALKAWIRGVTGYGANNVIKKNAGGPRPTGDHVVFQSPTVSESVGTVYTSGQSVTEGVVDRTHTKFVVVRTTLDVMSTEGSGVIDQLEMSLDTSGPRSLLEAADLTFVRRTATIFVPEYGDTEPRDRFTVDFYWYTQIDFAESDFELQQISAEITAVSPDESVISGEITVGETDD